MALPCGNSGKLLKMHGTLYAIAFTVPRFQHSFLLLVARWRALGCRGG